MTAEVDNISAEEYLNDSRFGQSNKSLSYWLNFYESQVPPPTFAITDAIVAKGRLAEHTLAVGEYHKLLTLIARYYPNSFLTWVSNQISTLLEMQHSHSREYMTRIGDNRYPNQLIPYFEQHPQFSQVNNFIEWYNADDL